MGDSKPWAALTVEQILAVCYRAEGSWPAVAELVAQGTGRAHSGRSASRWGNGHDMPGADVIVAALRSLPPDVREALLDGSYVEEPEASASSARLESLESEVARLRSEVALLGAIARTINARAGLQIFESLTGLNDQLPELDPPVAELLRQMGLISA